MHLYWKLLGMLQWAAALGRIDIMCAVMGGFRAQPRIGYLDSLKRIFGFLENYKSYSIKFWIDEQDYSKYMSEGYGWTNIYGNIQEEVPNNMPKAKGNKVTLTCFTDSNLSHDRMT